MSYESADYSIVDTIKTSYLYLDSFSCAMEHRRLERQPLRDGMEF